MRPTARLPFRPSRFLVSHENPIGLPRSNTPPRFQRGLPARRRIPHVAHVVAVSSAKGGVGKSTVAANMALALARLGHRSGILDMDVFGPSVPTLFGLQQQRQQQQHQHQQGGNNEPALTPSNQLVPLTAYGVRTMSMGYLVGEARAVVWRGPMLLKAVQQLLHEVDWTCGAAGVGGGLDVLVLDLPPGTGDTQLSIAQQVELDGAVIVTTPHALAVADAARGADMFAKVKVPVLGLVQNMSVFRCPCCGERTEVFGGAADVRRLLADRGLDMLGDVPLHASIGDDAARGKPTVVAEPDSERARVFFDIARRIGDKIGLEGG